MSPLEQIKAINRACGRPVVMNRFYNLDGRLEDHWSEGIGTDDTIPFPDYMNSLDVMHGAEIKCIYDKDLGMVFLLHLQVVCNETSPAKWDTTSRTLPCTSATASQRLEAALRTLHLWNDSI